MDDATYPIETLETLEPLRHKYSNISVILINKWKPRMVDSWWNQGSFSFYDFEPGWRVLLTRAVGLYVHALGHSTISERKDGIRLSSMPVSDFYPISIRGGLSACNQICQVKTEIFLWIKLEHMNSMKFNEIQWTSMKAGTPEFKVKNCSSRRWHVGELYLCILYSNPDW